MSVTIGERVYHADADEFVTVLATAADASDGWVTGGWLVSTTGDLDPDDAYYAFDGDLVPYADGLAYYYAAAQGETWAEYMAQTDPGYEPHLRFHRENLPLNVRRGVFVAQSAWTVVE